MKRWIMEIMGFLYMYSKCLKECEKGVDKIWWMWLLEVIWWSDRSVGW